MSKYISCKFNSMLQNPNPIFVETELILAIPCPSTAKADPKFEKKILVEQLLVLKLFTTLVNNYFLYNYVQHLFYNH